MAQVITGLDNIPLSAISAAYAPTNTADVTAMIDSAVSGKLDASASSSFQPVGNYVSSDDLSAYLPTSSIGVDSASAVTSIAGSSIASGEQVVTSISTGGYGVSAINGQEINASHMKLGAAAADNTNNIVKLGDSSYGAGVFLTGSFGTAYYKVNELQLNRNGTGFIGFNIGGAGSQITATSNAGGKFTAGGPSGSRSYYTAYNASASASIEVTADSAKINLADSGYTSTIYPSSIPYWDAKLDASSIETSVDGITGIGGTAIAGGGTTYTAGQYIQISGDEISVTGLQPSGDYVSSSELADYQPTSSMSAYATTGDLSAKLDASASSSFITSTSDCMPLSSSSEYYSTSNPSGFVTSSYSPTFGYYNGNISSIDGTGLMGTDTAVVLTNTAQPLANIESGLPSEDTYIFDPPVTAIKITVPGELGTEPWLNLNADNPDGNETVLAYSGTDSYYTYNTSLGGSGWTSISFYDTSYLIDGGIRGISATGYSDGVTSTAELMHLSASSNFYSTSNPAGYITGVDLTPYQTTAGMSAYLPTSAIHSDSAGITSIGGTAVVGKDYTAGAGIAITGSEISVNYDSNTLDTVASTVTITAAGTPEVYDPFMHINNASFTSLLNGQTAANVTVHIPSGFFSNSPYFIMSGYRVYLALYTADPRNGGTPTVYTYAPLSYQYDSLNDEYVIDEQDVVLSLPASGADWYPGTSLNFTDPYIVVVIAADPNRGLPEPVAEIAAESSTCTITYTSAASQALTVKNPLPASTSADANKVLTVNASGSPVWAVGGGAGGADWSAESGQPGYIENKPVPKTLVAGTGITITENSAELVVASTNALYSAGNGLTLNGTTFAVDTGIVATTADVSSAVSSLPSNLTSAQIQSFKEALGIDETVLWENSEGAILHNGITLSESRLNFKIIRLYLSCQSGVNMQGIVDIPMVGLNTGSAFQFQLNLPFSNETTATFALTWKVLMTATNTTLASTNALYWGKMNFDGTSANTGTWTQGSNANVPYIYKVVGIGRIASN